MKWPKMSEDKKKQVRRYFYGIRKQSCSPVTGASVCDSCGRKWGEKCPITPYGMYDQSCFERIR